MPLYLVHPSDIIFVKGYGFLSFAKDMSKNIGKSITKNVLIMLDNLLQIHLKLLLKQQFQKQQKQMVI